MNNTGGNLFLKMNKHNENYIKKIFLLKDNTELFLLTVPALLCFIIFSYLPMYGAVIAFKSYNYADGILGSKWIGLKNFEFFFTSQDAWRITRNTVGYNLMFIVVGTFCSVVMALFMYEISDRTLLCKIYQTAATIPRFMSWVVVGYIVYALLDPVKGVFNEILAMVGKEPAMWYMEPRYWPVILLFANLWKGVGMGSLIYYAALSGIDIELYESAKLDGANRRQQILYISLPGIIPIITILTILAVGGIFHGDFGLFYTIPMDIGTLYPVTDVIDTYVYRGLRTGDIGPTAAVGLFQSAVGLALVVVTNLIVKKVNPENSLF